MPYARSSGGPGMKKRYWTARDLVLRGWTKSQLRHSGPICRELWRSQDGSILTLEEAIRFEKSKAEGKEKNERCSYQENESTSTMTWREAKDAVESSGIKDGSELDYVHVAHLRYPGDSGLEVCTAVPLRDERNTVVYDYMTHTHRK